MKKTAGFLLLLACFLPCLQTQLKAQKVRYGQAPPKAKPGVDYPLTVHVSGIRVRQRCSNDSFSTTPSGISCKNVVYVDALTGDGKIELVGDWIWYRYPMNLTPGDYHARLLKDPHNATPIDREYEFVLPDRSVWRTTVTGFSE
jgi:hypothetical protein